MGHALTRGDPVLHRDVQRVRFIHALDGPRDAAHSEKQVGGFGGAELREPCYPSYGHDQNVAWEQGLNVYESVGELRWRQVEDLRGYAEGTEFQRGEGWHFCWWLV